jgi:hypothetical protein
MKEAGTQPESRAPKREVQGSASLDAAGSGTGGSGAVARIRAVHGLVLSRNSFGRDFVRIVLWQHVIRGSDQPFDF